MPSAVTIHGSSPNAVGAATSNAPTVTADMNTAIAHTITRAGLRSLLPPLSLSWGLPRCLRAGILLPSGVLRVGLQSLGSSGYVRLGLRSFALVRPLWVLFLAVSRLPERLALADGLHDLDNPGCRVRSQRRCSAQAQAYARVRGLLPARPFSVLR